MNTSEDEPSSGLNGRLRPRKSNAAPKTTKALPKTNVKLSIEKLKRTSTPSKASPSKQNNSPAKTDVLASLQFLCSYCDKTFISKQAVSKHVIRVHISSSKHEFFYKCLFCNHTETVSGDIICHMIDSHPNQYFACLNCHSRFHSAIELAEHKLNVCEKQKQQYKTKLRQKPSKNNLKSGYTVDTNNFDHEDKHYTENNGFNGIVISCELKPSNVHDEADIEDNITTNLILPPTKNLGNGPIIEKNAVIVLDDFQWNKRIPPNFNFHNTDPDQILSRLGVVHRGPRTGEVNKRDCPKIVDDINQKFEKCFDTSFYSKVASNVQENLSKFLDGSCNFNPDPDNTIKTRKSKNCVAINTAEGFPILLAFEQFSRNVFDGYMPRTIAPKYKWKWDNIVNDKALLSPEQIKRDSHANKCIITLVSRLDIWTQLCMRRKFESVFKSSIPVEKKTQKQNLIENELKEILEKRELPTTSSQVVKYNNPILSNSGDIEFPSLLGLAPTSPEHNLKPAVLSGEWVRPRCYVCCACGALVKDSRALSSHKATQHPNSQIQHYEVVGELLLNSDIFKHLYVPPIQFNNRTRPLRGYRECTKCKKSITLDDLHQHMLDCAGDTPAVRRKGRTARPFGVRKRRPRLPDNTIRKEIRKDIRSRHRKNHLSARPKNRSEVGDAETIRKMIADLPAKRHRVLVNPVNSSLRPRSKFDQQRKKLKIKKSLSDVSNTKRQSNLATVYSSLGNEKSNKKLLNIKDNDSRLIKTNVKQISPIKHHKKIFNINKRSISLKETSENQYLEEARDGEEPGSSQSDSDIPKKIFLPEENITVGTQSRANSGRYNTCAYQSSDGNSNEAEVGKENMCSNPQGSSGNSSRVNPDKELNESPDRMTPVKYNVFINQSSDDNQNEMDSTNENILNDQFGYGDSRKNNLSDITYTMREHGSQSHNNSNGRDSNESGRDSNESGRDSNESGRDSLESGSDNYQFGRENYQSGRKNKQSGRDLYQSSRGNYQSGRENNQPGPENTQYGRESHQTGRDHHQSGREHNQSGRDHNQSGRDHNQSGRDHNQSGRDHHQSNRDNHQSSRDNYQSGRDNYHSGHENYQSGRGNRQSGRENNQSDRDNNQPSGENNQSARENNQSGHENNRSGHEDNQSGRENDQSGRENDQSGRGNDQSGRENDQSGRENDQSGRENDQSGRENDQSGRENNQSGRKNNQSRRKNNQTRRRNNQSGRERRQSGREHFQTGRESRQLVRDNNHSGRNNQQRRRDGQHTGRDDQEPGCENEEPDRDSKEPGRNNQEPGRNNQEPAGNNQEPGRNNQEPGRINQEPGRDNQEPGRNNQESGRNNQEPGRNNQEPGRNNQESENRKPEECENQEQVQDNQQPGSKEENRNQRDSLAQSPSVPLKHSIASLTASSETHDKAVQFHHLFLVQQECNNITQHMPSDQKILFENEAVVTKLDKPPLQCNQGGIIDQHTQKNKNNKPRKGLNDCIAMLKNKLEVPNPLINVKSSNTHNNDQKSEPKGKSSPTKLTHEIAVQCVEFDNTSNIPSLLKSDDILSQDSSFFVNKTVVRNENLITYDDKITKPRDCNEIVHRIPSETKLIHKEGDKIAVNTKSTKISLNSSDIVENTAKKVNKKTKITTSKIAECKIKESIIGNNGDDIKNTHITVNNVVEIKDLIPPALVANKIEAVPDSSTNVVICKIDINTSANVIKSKTSPGSDDKMKDFNPYHTAKSTHIKTHGPDTTSYIGKSQEFNTDNVAVSGTCKILSSNIIKSAKHLDSVNTNIIKNKANVAITKVLNTDVTANLKSNNNICQYNDQKSNNLSPVYTTNSKKNKELIANRPASGSKTKGIKFDLPTKTIVSKECAKKIKHVNANHTETIIKNKSIIPGNSTRTCRSKEFKTKGTANYNLVTDISVNVRNTKDLVLDIAPRDKKFKRITSDKEKQLKDLNESATDINNINNRILETSDNVENNNEITAHVPSIAVNKNVKVFVNRDISQNNKDFGPKTLESATNQIVNWNFEPPISKHPHNNYKDDLIYTKKQKQSKKAKNEFNDTESSSLSKPVGENLISENLTQRLDNPDQDEFLSEETSIQDLRQQYLTIQEDFNSDIPPAHCNIHIESILLAPLDLSGKISSTQTDVSTYNNCETLDLSNKNHNREDPVDFRDEDIVDLSIKHTNPANFQNNIALESSITDTATDLSLGNNQIPKDLSLKGNTRSLSIDNNVTSQYDTCSSDLYFENTCVDYSFKGGSSTKNKRRTLGISLEEYSRNEETNEEFSNVATNLCIKNMTENHSADDVNRSDAPIQLYNIEESNYSQHLADQPDQLILSESGNQEKEILERSTEFSSPILHQGDHLTTVDLSSDMNKHYSSPPINKQFIYTDKQIDNDPSVHGTEMLRTYPFSKSPLYVPETIPTSVPAYKFPNRILASSSTFESTSPVYTLANTCISVSKIESSNSTTLTNMLLSVPGNTITNTTSVYTLAGPTIGPPLNYNPISSALNIEAIVPCINMKDNTEPSLQKIVNVDNKLSTVNDDTESPIAKMGENVNINSDQDPEIAKKIALLPKELVEILGTMPLGHCKQLLNILPQYVSTSTSGSLKNSDNEVSVESRHVNHTPPPSTLPVSYSGISPISFTSSFLLTPPTPNLPGRQLNKNIQDSSKSVVEEIMPLSTENELCTPKSGLLKNRMLKNIQKDNHYNRIIDLTGDDNLHVIPETTVYTSSDLSLQTPFKMSDMPSNLSKTFIQKTNSDKTSSLRAVRIKTQSERQKSMYPESQIRKKSIEVPVTTISNLEETNIPVDSTKHLIIQQGEVSSTQHSSIVNVTSTSKVVCITTDKEEPMPKNEVNTCIEDESNQIKLCDPNNVNLENMHSSKDYDRCISSSIRDKRGDKEIKLNDNPSPVTSFSSTQELISSNNNITQLKVQTQEITPSDKKNVSEDDSDDDISLAVILRNRDKPEENCDIPHTSNEELEKHCEQVTSSRPTIESIEEVSPNIEFNGLNNSKPSDSTITKSMIDHTENEKLNVACKEKSTKKENEKLNVAFKEKSTKNENEILLNESKEIKNIEILEKHLEHDQANVCGINKDNKTDSESENTECTTNKIEKNDVISNFNSTENIDNTKKVTDEIQLVEKVTSPTPDYINDPKEADGNVEIFVDQASSEHVTTTQKSIHCRDNESLNVIESLPNVPRKNTELPSVSSVGNENLEDTMEKFTPTIANEAMEQQQPDTVFSSSPTEESTITSLRRSTRRKSLFLDSKLSSSNNATPIDTITEYKGPLTKKQLIFSKLQLDEENQPFSLHHVVTAGGEIEGNKNKLDNSNLDGVQDTSNNMPVSTTISERLPAKLHKKSNKRKKSQAKQRSKKKKLRLDVLVTPEKTNVNIARNCTMENDIKEITNLATNLRSSSVPHESNEVSLEIQYQKTFETATNITKLHNSSNNNCNAGKESNKKLVSSEKRKSDSKPENDSITCSVPKKSKSDDGGKEEEESRNDTPMQTTVALDCKTKGRTLPCYSNAGSTRRARSKSVFVNSSPSEHYDPYDIDFDEMNEASESITTKHSRKPYSKTTKSTKLNNSNSSKAISYNIDDRYVAIPSTSKYEGIALAKVQNTIKPYKHHRSYYSDDSDLLSDSDDSSKSDVPLKKYAEEKEKKLLDVHDTRNKARENTVKISNKSSSGQASKSRKKTKRLVAVEDKVDDAKTRQETEEQLRSEQFMESFGFFSERKPRKSNLLASKKISETLANESEDFDDDEDEDDEEDIRERQNNRRADRRQYAEQNVNRRYRPRENHQEKKGGKHTKKKNNCTLVECSLCQICKTEFRRPDNYLRHQMTLLHISKLSEEQLKVKTTPVDEEPNYLIAYKVQIIRRKIIKEAIDRRNKNSLPTDNIAIPTGEEILAGVRRTIREQQLSRRGLSTDEALFLDCCELLKESHKGPDAQKMTTEGNVRRCNSLNCASAFKQELLELQRSIDPKSDYINEGEVDLITAQNILNSEEVRNLENDLISGLKEAANASKINENNRNLQLSFTDLHHNTAMDGPSTSFANAEETAVQNNEEELNTNPKRSTEIKEKMYPDIEDIDLFEDKFDKIKRKCRSQAAAAKQSQTRIETITSQTVRRNKKKIKKKAKNPNAVMTKGALKGFDGIKVSIVTTDINISIITPSAKNAAKKKKSQSKKKASKKSEKSTNENESGDHQETSSEKQLDVYEFMDTDDAEVFDFRPSTIMERFKSISNKELPSTSKSVNKFNEVQISSDTLSDGDDFVYMSDDYVCSEEETENSIISCELKNTSEQKRTFTPQKKRDTTEKSAVMEKIFKHNAVRSEKKHTKNKEIVKPKANLDQLFDSLLHDEPNTSKNTNYMPISPKRDQLLPPLQESDEILHTNSSDQTIDSNQSDDLNLSHATKDVNPKTTSKVRKCSNSPVTYEVEYEETSSQCKSKDCEENIDTSDLLRNNDETMQSVVTQEHDTLLSSEFEIDFVNSLPCQSKEKKMTTKMHNKDRRDSIVVDGDIYDSSHLSEDTGVARQRARRKCTVGKQNILAETWSSESEPDGMPPRPNSAESVVGANRRRKGKKKEGNSSGHKKSNNKHGKRNDYTSGISISSDPINESTAEGDNIVATASRRVSFRKPSLTASATTSYSCSVKSRTRPNAYYWSEGDEEPEHLQQHGWIVGDSHKKLVTMLAHAKGRKRNNDDKRHLAE